MRSNCHVAIYDGAADRILMVDGPGGARLPTTQVTMPWPWTGDVRCLNEAAAEKLGQDVITLRCVPLGPRSGDSIEALVFMETRASNTAPSSAGRWLSRLDGAVLEHQPTWARSALAMFLQEIGGECEPPAQRTPWARPGWFADATTWAETELRRIGRPRIGTPEQVRQWSISSIIRIPTSKEDVWFKAVPAFFRHEGALMRCLEKSSSDTPTVLALEERRGWMLMEAIPGAPVTDLLTIREALQSLARLQTSWVGRTDELLALGCPDRRIASLPVEIESLVQRDDLRKNMSDAALSRLDLAVKDLPRMSAELGRCGVPETLMHGDFHPGNIIASANGPVLIDWTDGCVSHPFFDLATVLPDDPETRITLLSPYLASWHSAFPSADVERACALSESLACLHHAVSYQRIVDRIEPDSRWGLGGAVARWFERYFKELDGERG